MLKPLKSFLAITCLLLLIPLRSWAIEVELPNPIFGLTGTNRNQVIYVSNPSAEFKAVEITVKKRSCKLDGEEILEDTEDFIIYPNQLLLRPGETIVSTVSWLGTEKPTQELAFRIIIEELATPKSKSAEIRTNKISVSLNIKYRYVYAMYVVPQNVAPDVHIQSAKRVKKKGSPQLELILNNRGTAHQIMKKLQVKFVPQNGFRKEILFQYSQKEFGLVNLLAGEKRRFYLPLPGGLAKGNFKASILSLGR